MTDLIRTLTRLRNQLRRDAAATREAAETAEPIGRAGMRAHADGVDAAAKVLDDALFEEQEHAEDAGIPASVDLLGQLRGALYDLSGTDCECHPIRDEINGVPVDELGRDLHEDEIDRSDCVWHDPLAQASYLLQRGRNLLDRWEARR